MRPLNFTRRVITWSTSTLAFRDLPQPYLQQQIYQKQFQQAAKRGGKRAKKNLEKSRVFVKSFNSSETLRVSGIVKKPSGLKLYLIELPDSQLVRQHIDHIWDRATI